MEKWIPGHEKEEIAEREDIKREKYQAAHGVFGSKTS